MFSRLSAAVFILAGFVTGAEETAAQATRKTEVYQRIKLRLDTVPAIDTHDHLWPFQKLPGYCETRHGRGMNLSGIWGNSYWPQVGRLTPWQPGMEFEDWWKDAKDDWDNSRSTSFYRYTQIALKDLYGVDWDRITDAQAAELNQRIFENYRDEKWLHHVVTERANIELMFNDPYWARYTFRTSYPFEVMVLNVNPLVHGFHASEFANPDDSPYDFATKHGLPFATFDEYLAVIDHMFLEAKDKGAVCLKNTLAYQRTLLFDRVPKERAAIVFGNRRSTLTSAQIKDFEDFMIWHLCELSAKFELPFQFHTGHGRLQGSSPVLLLDLIEANPRTQFILFHGGFPWTAETGAILLRHWSHVWIDSVWLPSLSYSMAKRSYHEWLEQMPSNRILWGADCNHGEGIYGSTELTRQCICEVLAEKVERGDLLEDHAERIGRQILRDNALELFPQLKERLWKHKQPAEKTLVP